MSVGRGHAKLARQREEKNKIKTLIPDKHNYGRIIARSMKRITFFKCQQKGISQSTMHSIQLRVDCRELHPCTNQELHSQCNLRYSHHAPLPLPPLACTSADLWWCMSRLIKHASRVSHNSHERVRGDKTKEKHRVAKHGKTQEENTHTKAKSGNRTTCKKKKQKKLNKPESSSWQKQSKVPNTPQKVTKSSLSVCARFESNNSSM